MIILLLCPAGTAPAASQKIKERETPPLLFLFLLLSLIRPICSQEKEPTHPRTFSLLAAYSAWFSVAVGAERERERMDALDRAACFMEELLDFASDIGEEEEADDETSEKTKNSLTSSSSVSLLPEFEEEELEWISNKDAFPMVESFVDIIPNHPSIASTTTTTATTTTNHHSPVSVLETSCGSSSGSSHGGGSAMVSLSSNFKVPGKARSKQLRKRRRDMVGEQWHSWGSREKTHKPNSRPSSKPSSTIGRKCLHCQAEKTPQWRAGPYGPKTLCNACGVRYKSGRLVPEYRPASSPTFSSELHSNSHRKIMEMRKQKIVMVPGSEAEAKPKEEIG